MDEKKPVSQVIALKQYFGLKEGQTLKDFATECAALSPSEKKELATAAAKELGVDLQVD
jgi:hypothetical protein